MSLLTLFDHFLTLHLFLGATTKGWKESIGFPDSELNAGNLFRKKFISKIKYSKSSPDPDLLGVTINCHIISFRFLPISWHLWTNQENQNRSVRSRRISFIWVENFWLSQDERFLELIEKSPYIVNYLWAGVSNYVCSISLVITKIYIFPLLYFTSVLLLKMRSQASSITWKVTSTAAFYLCWTYTEHFDLWIRCVVYIWY